MTHDRSHPLPPGVYDAPITHALERRLTRHEAALREIEEPTHGGAAIRPAIPNAVSDLVVNGRHDAALGPDVKRELAPADPRPTIRHSTPSLPTAADTIGAPTSRCPGAPAAPSRYLTELAKTVLW